MKIFISWSGNRSHQVAQLLDTWIQCVIQAVDPWLSSKDIERGSLWFSEITGQLATTHNGIICITKENLNRPWILFEAGALAKGLSSNRVFTFLIDLQPRDVRDPLAQFNHTLPNKEDVLKLLKTINSDLGERALKEEILKNVFEKNWPDFEEDFQKIIEETMSEEVKLERPKDDLLSEILYSVRSFDKRLKRIENNSSKYEIKKSVPEIFTYSMIKDVLFAYSEGLKEETAFDIIYSNYGEKGMKIYNEVKHRFEPIEIKSVFEAEREKEFIDTLFKY